MGKKVGLGKKQRSFADKISKGTGPRGEVCPTCQQIIRNIKVVRAMLSEKQSWAFDDRMQKVCKCNEKDILV
jgi:hypothetical protein